MSPRLGGLQGTAGDSRSGHGNGLTAGIAGSRAPSPVRKCAGTGSTPAASTRLLHDSSLVESIIYDEWGKKRIPAFSLTNQRCLMGVSAFRDCRLPNVSSSAHDLRTSQRQESPDLESSRGL